MIDINLNGALPTHVDRIKPKISVDKSGKINWVPGYLDYNASNYFPGKTVRSEEFNKHNLQQVYQGNYITDVLQLIFDKHLPDAVYKLFTSEFNLAPSFVKTFTADDWGEKQEDGYYYITVTAEEHGFPADTAEGVLERMNIDTEMYLLNTDGNFYEVQQISTASDNTVQAYSDDNTLAGFLVIRTNDKAYALAEASIHASQIVGLADSALSGKYADLVDLTRPDGTGPDDRITDNAKGIASILSGIDDDNKVVKVAKALQADNAKEATAMLGTGTLGGRIIDNIFEVGSNTVKKATNADNAKESINSNYATNATNAIVNADNTYSGFIKDAAGILKTNGELIERKRVLFNSFISIPESTSSSSSVIVPFVEGVSSGDVIEIHFSIGMDAYNSVRVKAGESINLHNLGSFSYSSSTFYFNPKFLGTSGGSGRGWIYDTVTKKFTGIEFNRGAKFMPITFTDSATSTVKINQDADKNYSAFIYKIYKIIE